MKCVQPAETVTKDNAWGRPEQTIRTRFIIEQDDVGRTNHDDFFEDCCLSTGEYDWSKHDDLIDAYDTAGNDDDDTLEAIKAYLDAGCSPSYFGQAYRGSYRDGAAFAEEEYSEMIEGRELLQDLVIDWEATWQGMHDYVEYGNGYFFRNM